MPVGPTSASDTLLLALQDVQLFGTGLEASASVPSAAGWSLSADGRRQKEGRKRVKKIASGIRRCEQPARESGPASVQQLQEHALAERRAASLNDLPLVLPQLSAC